MKWRLPVRIALLTALVTPLPSSAAQAQDREAALERILNPLPDYDPFEAAAPPPQYFPDEVDKRARELLVDVLTNRADKLDDHLEFFKAEDARLRAERGTRTGLAEHAQDMLNNTIADRERFLAAQRKALRAATSPERRKYLESILNQDDLNQADQLMRQSSTNQWGGILNRLMSSVDLVGVASGNYIGAAAETVVSQIYALTDRDMSIEERRALARHLEHLKRYPDDPRNAAVIQQVRGIELKKKSILVKRQLAKGREAMNKGETDRARFHFELASFIDPESKTVGDALRELAGRRQSESEAVRASLAAAEENASVEPGPDEHRLLAALSLRDPAALEREAIAIERRHRGTPLGDAALDAEAVALEMSGRHETAKRIVEQVAREARDPADRKRAAALLQSPEYNLLATFRAARSERRAESVKYVLFGEDLLKKNLLYAAGAVAAAGPAGAATLGAVNVLMIGNNLVSVLGNNPISAQPVIDAGVAYVRNHPESENASEVYRVLAEAYEERGMYDKAIHFHELAGSPKDTVEGLKIRAAKALVDAAGKSRSRDIKERYLTAVIDAYPETPAAAEATRLLAQLVRSENRGLRLSRQFLKENPEIYGPRGLGLKPSLLDGDPRNMELADRGVNLVDGDELVVYYQTPWGVRSQSYDLPKRNAERFFVALREKNYEIALADANRRARDSVGGIKNLPTQIAQARNRREAEEPAEDPLFSFIRQADGSRPSYPTVLDHELLAESERDPEAKYRLPPIQGSISASRFSMSGALPTGLWGNQIAIGNDPKSPFAGVELPIPLLQGFIPVDFMVQGRPGGFSVYPKIHTDADRGQDQELYR